MVSFGSTVQFAVPHITIRNLNKYYDVQGKQVHALKNINLDIPEGKIFGIIGKSGAGKSSLIRTLNGLEKASNGNIQIHKQELSKLNHSEFIVLRQRIGMIFQHFNLMSAKTVYENVALPLKVAQYDELEDTPENVQATLLKLTTRAIKKAIYRSPLDTGEVYVCGGGAYNSHLLEQLRWRLRKHNWSVQTTTAIGLSPTWVEGTAFAWLAMRFMNQLAGNLPEVTGAKGSRILGTITAV